MQQKQSPLQPTPLQNETTAIDDAFTLYKNPDSTEDDKQSAVDSIIAYIEQAIPNSNLLSFPDAQTSIYNGLQSAITVDQVHTFIAMSISFLQKSHKAKAPDNTNLDKLRQQVNEAIETSQDLYCEDEDFDKILQDIYETCESYIDTKINHLKIGDHPANSDLKKEDKTSIKKAIEVKYRNPDSVYSSIITTINSRLAAVQMEFGICNHPYNAQIKPDIVELYNRVKTEHDDASKTPQHIQQLNAVLSKYCQGVFNNQLPILPSEELSKTMLSNISSSTTQEDGITMLTDSLQLFILNVGMCIEKNRPNER